MSVTLDDYRIRSGNRPRLCSDDAPGLPARNGVAGSGRAHDDGDRWDTSRDVGPSPVQFAPRVNFLKEEVFEICAAVALAESLCKRLGLDCEAAHLASVFEVVERRLI